MPYHPVVYSDDCHTKVIGGVNRGGSVFRYDPAAHKTVHRPFWWVLSPGIGESYKAVLPDKTRGEMSATRQESSVSVDSDGDGLVDFDEDNRFAHDLPMSYEFSKSNADTDGNGSTDKQDLLRELRAKGIQPQE